MLYYIDIVDACNLRCRTCVRGQRKMKNSKEKMSFSEFKEILAKAKEKGATVIGLYNWTEPFLHPEIAEFVKEIVDNDMHCVLSSNLALPDMTSLIDTLDAGVSELSVSVSGFTNDIYQTNHKGGDVAVVKRNLTIISKYLLESSKDIDVCVKYLEFDYNKEEINVFKEFSESLGLNFFVHPASGDPFESIEDDTSSANKITVDTQKMRSLETPLTNPCGLLFDVVALDHKGDVYLCCAHGNCEDYRIGNFLTMDYEKMMLSRLFHPQCRTCTMFRRSPSNEDLLDIDEWFGKSFLGESFTGLNSVKDGYGCEEKVPSSLEQGVEGPIIEYENRVAELNESIVTRDARNAELDRQITDRDRQLEEILSSTSWRISLPLRLVKKIFKNNSF